jgi:hypothetical protein
MKNSTPNHFLLIGTVLCSLAFAADKSSEPTTEKKYFFYSNNFKWNIWFTKRANEEYEFNEIQSSSQAPDNFVADRYLSIELSEPRKFTRTNVKWAKKYKLVYEALIKEALAKNSVIYISADEYAFNEPNSRTASLSYPGPITDKQEDLEKFASFIKQHLNPATQEDIDEFANQIVAAQERSNESKRQQARAQIKSLSEQIEYWESVIENPENPKLRNPLAPTRSYVDGSSH